MAITLPPNFIRILIWGILLGFGLAYLGSYVPLGSLSGWGKKTAIETPTRMALIASIPNTLANWPPHLQEVFPDESYYDHTGASFSMTKLRGKPTLVEFVAMTCAACQAWSGAHKYGAYNHLAVQEDLQSIEEYFHQFSGGAELFDGSINFVQLVIYNTALEAPTQSELAEWRKHFQFDRYANVHVISGGEALRNRESYVRVPGFALLDRQGVLRFDALGHTPRHDLYRELLPAATRLVAAK